MIPDSPLLRRLTWWLLALACAAGAWATESTPLRSTLALVGTSAGRAAPLIAVQGETLMLGETAEPTAADAATRWTLEGDIHAAPHLLAWSPQHEIVRDARVAVPAYIARVTIRHLVDLAPQPAAVVDRDLKTVARSIARTPDPFATRWPGEPGRPGAIVAVWIVDGRAVRTHVQAVPQTRSPRDFELRFTFELTPDEARGHPALLLWRDDGFVPASPFSSDAATQAAFHAVFLHDTAAFAAAQREGAHLKASSEPDRATLAHFAAEVGATDILARLGAARPALLASPDGAWRTPLDRAAAHGRTAALTHLLPVYRTRAHAAFLESALQAAVHSGHIPEVMQLSVEIRRADGIVEMAPSLQRVALEQGFPDIVAALMDLPKSPSLKEGRPLTEAQRRLLDSDGMTALLVEQIRTGNLPMVERMLTAASPDTQAMSGGQTPLVAAAAGGHDRIVRLLLEAGAHPDAPAQGGQTALIEAASSGHAAIVDILLDAGARPTLANDEGMSALHYAAGRDDVALVERLLAAGVDVQLCSLREITPLDLALLTGSAGSVRLLSSRGACIGLGAPNSSDLLLAAISHDIAGPLSTAIDQGWPAASTFAGTWPALRVAEILGAQDCAKILRTAGATAQPDRPVPVVDEKELDAPLQLSTEPVVRDPRRPDENFPALLVRVRVLVDTQGRPLFPQILDPIDARVKLAVMRSIQQAHYTSPRRAGAPVAVRAVLEICLPASRDRVFSESEVTEGPRVRRTSRPCIPRSATRSARNLRVVASFVVNALGRVEQVTIDQSSGPDYVDSVLLALSERTYDPARYRDTCVAVRQTKTFTFDRRSAEATR